jgi:caa(3)-type oxidase subunit IV
MSEHQEPAVPQDKAPSAGDVEAFNKHFRAYLKIGVIEFIFTVVTVAVSFLFKNMATKVTLTLLSALGNAVFVAAILMHLKEEKKMIWKVLYFTGAFLVILFFLTWLARTDEITATLHNHH